ncbi:MAG TPA: glycosyltransferase family 2 protein [Vicinamibacterales bacterium]
MMTVCALIAAFNEEDSIAAVVTGVLRLVPDVVVVDDGSTDRTGERAAAAGATVLAHARNRGKGAAIRTGLAHVLPRPFSHVLFIDGDLQHDPNDIPLLFAAAERSGCDAVIAERTFTKGEMPTARFYSNRIGSRILSAFIGTEVTDSQSGFRLVRSECLRALRLTATGYEVETEMLIKLARHGASLCRVSIAARYHGSRSKLRSFRDTFRTCMLAVRYRYLTIR